MDSALATGGGAAGLAEALAGGARVIDPVGRRRTFVFRPGQALRHGVEVFDGLARRENVDGVAVPRQSDIGGGTAPQRGMANVRFVERAPLPPVDRAGVTVFEAVELAGRAVLADDETDLLRLRAFGRVERHGHARPVAAALGYDRLNLDLVGDEREIPLIAPIFGHLVKQYDYVICDLPNEVSASVFACLVQSDKVFIISRYDDEHLYRTRLLLEDFRSHATPREPEVRVILTAVGEARAPYVEEAERKVGQPIAYLLRWIPETEVVEAVDGTPYVIRQPMGPYSLVVRRMARELGNVLVGLALGTGGARGLAHIGVIRVLEREGIAIDVVAGQLDGLADRGGVGGGQVRRRDGRDCQADSQQADVLEAARSDVPGAGVFRGIKVYNFLHSIVNGLTFADTLIPLKIVASDLNTLEEVVYEEGKLIDAIRASITIPGIFRPVVSNGHTLIDGGITDPVPVQVLTWAGVSKIIAVNTIPNTDEMKQRERSRHEMSTATQKERRGVLHETGPLVETPTSIINIYMRSMHAMQSRMAEMACNNADVVIRPMLAGGVWYDFYHPERYIRCGEEAAEAALPQLKELVRA